MSEVYKFELKSLSEHEMSELRKLKDIRFLREVPNTVPLTGAVDSFGNEIIPKKNEYDVLVEVITFTWTRQSSDIISNKFDTIRKRPWHRLTFKRVPISQRELRIDRPYE